MCCWFESDAVIAEYFNWEEFEAELRAILDEDRAEKRDLLTAALMDKAVAMDAAVDETFTLRDLSSGN